MITFKRRNLVILKSVLRDYTGEGALVSDESYLMDDLKICGDDFDQVLVNFLRAASIQLSNNQYLRIQKLMPSETYAIIGWMFMRKKDLTVAGLIDAIHAKMSTS